MIKELLKRRGKERDPHEPGHDAYGYDITTAKLPGRSIIAFEKRGGQVAALEVTEQGAEILRGLAAGAVLSELDEAKERQARGLVMPLTEDRGATREEAEAFIQSLDLLDQMEKRALTQALPR